MSPALSDWSSCLWYAWPVASFQGLKPGEDNWNPCELWKLLQDGLSWKLGTVLCVSPFQLTLCLSIERWAAFSLLNCVFPIAFWMAYVWGVLNELVRSTWFFLVSSATFRSTLALPLGECWRTVQGWTQRSMRPSWTFLEPCVWCECNWVDGLIEALFNVLEFMFEPWLWSNRARNAESCSSFFIEFWSPWIGFVSSFVFCKLPLGPKMQ